MTNSAILTKKLLALIPRLTALQAKVVHLDEVHCDRVLHGVGAEVAHDVLDLF